ncbi:MAG: GTP-binding protein EngA, GTPase, partial [Pseudomonadota bacterium]
MSAPAQRPSIAIVGRPNVGKSTLFNRLTGTRAALVSDLPGLTRDWKRGEAVLGGHTLDLFDTAGLEEADKGSIAARMREKSEAAIAKADLVLFVIDARAGVTGADEAFARIVRHAAKPVVLIANKAEGRAADAGIYEAFALGLGEPVGVSAEHGEGMGDLEHHVLAALGLKAIERKSRKRRREDDDMPEEPVAEEETGARTNPIRVAIVGRPNAGKSTLVNALVGEERMITGPEPGLTRDSVATDITWNGTAVRLYDTAGLRKKAKIDDKAELLSASDAIRAIRFAEVVVLLVDAERPLEQQDLIIGNRITDEGRAIVVAVNKWDLIPDKQKTLKDIRETVEETLAQVKGVSIVTVSALSGRGIENLEKAVLDAYRIWNTRISTSKLNQWLSEATQRHAAPQSKGRRVKLRFMTQPSARPPTFVAFVSQPAGLPKSYIKYLTNSLR